MKTIDKKFDDNFEVCIDYVTTREVSARMPELEIAMENDTRYKRALGRNEAIKQFYNQQIKEIIDKIIGEAVDDEYIDKLVEEGNIMAGESEDIRYGACVSRAYGSNEKRQEIINIAKEYGF